MYKVGKYVVKFTHLHKMGNDCSGYYQYAKHLHIDCENTFVNAVSLLKTVKQLMRRNGYTTCIITVVGEDQKPVELARGDAQCSKHDQFNKRTGRIKSFGRALAKLSDEDRLEVSKLFINIAK